MRGVLQANLQQVDWSALPKPDDDGAARHLTGQRVPDHALQSTSGGAVNLSALAGRTVLYIYPMTGQPGVALPDGWDEIPGARGCTPQSCAFRDHYADLLQAGAARVFGLSSQACADQREAAGRLHLPFALLSDADLAFARALALPTFSLQHRVLLKRMALVIDEAVITKVFYPAFPPDQNAADVLAWLKDNPI